MMYNGGPNQPELSAGSIRLFMCEGCHVICIVLTVGSLYYDVITINGVCRQIAKTVPYKQVKLSFSERARVNKARDLLMQKVKIRSDITALEIEEERINKELGTLGF